MKFRDVHEFWPTEAEFEHFEQYMASAEVSRAGFESGAVRPILADFQQPSAIRKLQVQVLIHPPKGWKARESYGDVITLAVPTEPYKKLTRPIRQKAVGERGVYQVQTPVCGFKVLPRRALSRALG